MVAPSPTPVHNERIKLLAGAINNLALAVIVAGFVAPAVTGHLGGLPQLLVSLAWLGMGVVLHLVA
ncbi:MAG: hypothetical protein BGO51_26035 [Rhodospirillales bacterium 69-11]|nr:MAG: hypothetical protein BGO51_26035 [Rhodospirillales bacterium 69-11]